jgi:hypothetical protein
VDGIREGGGLVLQPLNAEQTVAVQVSSGISNNARINIARMLSAFNGGQRVFACETACSSVISAHLTTQHFREYRYTELDPATGCEIEVVQEYYYIDPYQAVINQLKTMRDSFPAEAMGITLGTLGDCIAGYLRRLLSFLRCSFPPPFQQSPSFPESRPFCTYELGRSPILGLSLSKRSHPRT